jgi:hypothetical protein
MKTLTAALFLTALPLAAQDSQEAKLAQIDEAFRLAAVRATLETLPNHANEMTVAALATIPSDKQKPFLPVIKQASRNVLEPNACYPLVRRYFLKHYDAAHLRAFIALEQTSVYRTWRRLEQQASLPALQTARRGFLENLKEEPPPFERRQLMAQLDDATDSTGLEVRLVIAVLNSTAAAMGANMPSDLDLQSTAFTARIQPALQERTLANLCFTLRGADDAGVQDYIDAALQPDVAWFNRNLHAAILSLVGDRASAAADYIKSHPPKPFN